MKTKKQLSYIDRVHNLMRRNLSDILNTTYTKAHEAHYGPLYDAVWAKAQAFIAEHGINTMVLDDCVGLSPRYMPTTLAVGVAICIPDMPLYMDKQRPECVERMAKWVGIELDPIPPDLAERKERALNEFDSLFDPVMAGDHATITTFHRLRALMINYPVLQMLDPITEWQRWSNCKYSLPSTLSPIDNLLAMLTMAKSLGVEPR